MAFPCRATPTAVPCTGTTYNILLGDTCNSIAESHGIDTVGLLAANHLASCASLPTSGTLCIPTASQCTTYTVQSGDTCNTIADAHGLIFAQIVSWNAVLLKDCSAIVNAVGTQICVSTPGGGWVDPDPSDTIALTTTATFT
jgi:LysM repeat protein